MDEKIIDYTESRHRISKNTIDLIIDKEWLEKKNILVVKKTTQCWNNYKSERDFYLFIGCNLDFVPKLFQFDDESKTIWVQYCGIALDLKYPEIKDRIKFKPAIRKMLSFLKDNYDLYHNDVRWKNILESDSGKLYLIDFAGVSKKSKEKDKDKIMSDE